MYLIASQIAINDISINNSFWNDIIHIESEVYMINSQTFFMEKYKICKTLKKNIICKIDL